MSNFFDWSNRVYGLIAAILALVTLWQMRKRKAKTNNTISGGSGNTQKGGTGDTVNKITDGDNNKQQG